MPPLRYGYGAGRASSQLALAAVLALLVFLHLWLRPRVSDPRWMPDFLLVALLLFAMRFRPAWGAGAGFALGLMTDALSPVAFGAAALAHTLVGYLAGMLKAVFFTDKLLVNALFFFVASWLRDALQISVGSLMGADAGLVRLFVRSPVDAAATTAVALAILVVFRGWLSTEEPALGMREGRPL